MTKTICLLILTLATLAAPLPAADSPSASVTAVMEEFRQAMLHRDRAALNRLTSEDLWYTHSAGSLESKSQFVESIASGKSVVQKLEFSAPAVQVYGDTALYKCRVDLWHSSTDIVHMDILHVWVRSAGSWKLVARQATRLAK